MTSRLVVLLVALGLSASSVPAFGGSDDRRAQESPNDSAVDELALSDAQRLRVAEIREREARRVRFLQRALVVTELELRRAELASPFDAERVNALIAQAAELNGFLRGTESRLVSDIAALLTEPQRQAFARMRTAAPPEPRAAKRPRQDVLQTEA